MFLSEEPQSQFMEAFHAKSPEPPGPRTTTQKSAARAIPAAVWLRKCEREK
jgi:hypothetical protein